MLRPYKRFSITALSLLVSTGLIPPAFAGDVKAQTSKNADFAHYKTYSWFPPRVLTKMGEVENDPSNPIIKETVGAQLMQKGLTEVADAADLQIQVTVLTDTAAQLEAAVFAFTPFDMGITQIGTLGRYNRSGTLYVNLIDRRTQKTAWMAM